MKDVHIDPESASVEELTTRYIQRRERIRESQTTKFEAFKDTVRNYQAPVWSIGRPYNVADGRNAKAKQYSQGRRWFHRGVAVTLLAVLTKILAPAETDQVLSWTLNQVPIGEMAVADLHQQIGCNRRWPVTDSSGQTLALQPVAAACRKFPQGYLSAPVSTATALTWARAIETIEGSSLISARNLLGVLDFAIVKRLAEHLGGKLTGSGGLKRLTGTPPLLSAIEVAINQPGALGPVAKLKTLAIGAKYSARHFAGDMERAKFMAQNLPCVRGASGSRFGKPIAGGLCAEALLGKLPAEATGPVDACLWAGAVGFQVRYWTLDTSETARDQARKSVERVRLRARNCLMRLLPEGMRRTEAFAQVEKWAPQQTIRRFIERRAANSLHVVLADALAGSDALGPVRTTLLGDTQAEVWRRVRKAVDALDPLLSPDLCSRAGCLAPDISMVVAEVVGNRLLTRAIYINRHGALFPVAGQGHKAPRSLGSVSKVPMTLVADPDNLLCNRAVGEIQNPDGDKGHVNCSGAAMVAASTVFAQSLNLPLIDLGTKDRKKLRAIYRVAGYRLSGAFPTSAVLGFGATASLARHVAVLAAINAGAEGRASKINGLELISGQPVEGVDLSGLGLSVVRYRSALSLLAGAGEGGTLAGLNRRLRLLGCERTFSKSGSAETQTATDGVKTRAMVALAHCGTRTLVVGLFIGAPGNVDQHIGRIPGRALIEIAMSGIAPVLARPKHLID